MAENVASQEPPGGRWMIVVVGIIIQLCLGAIYAYGAVRGDLSNYFKALMGIAILTAKGVTFVGNPLLDPQVVAFVKDATMKGPNALDMTWPFIIFLGVFALTMPLAGPYIQKMGPKKVGMIGGALCGLGWLAASYASSPTMLIPLYAVIGGLGVGIAYGVPIACSAQWFPDKRGLAVGLTVLGFGFSSALISYATLFMKSAGYQIMNILQVYGIAFIIITIVASMYLRFPPAGWKPAGWSPPTPVAGAAQKIDFMRNEMTKTGTFKGLWLCYTIGALAGLTAIGIVGPVGKEVMTNAGMSAAASTTLVFQLILPFAICNGLGRPIFGTLTDKLTPKNAAIVTFVGIIVACLLMYMSYSSVMAFIVSFCLLWGCLGAWLAIAPTATATYFGMKDNAKNYGLVFTAYGVGAVVGGIVSAEIAATTTAAKGATFLDAYRPFFLVVAVLAVLGVVIAFMLLKPPVKNTA
jgi:OFA family oxalate/formate antiporter-like MFS transporter